MKTSSDFFRDSAKLVALEQLRHHPNYHETCVYLFSDCTVDGPARAVEFLSQIGLIVPPVGNGDRWITLCQVQARVATSGLTEKIDIQTCTKTARGEIKETRVKVNVEWRCEYAADIYASGTMITYQNNVASQYDAAIKLAKDALDQETASYLETMKNQHVQNLQTAGHKDTGKLTAKATSAPKFGDGANCDLTLEGRVNELY